MMNIVQRYWDGLKRSFSPASGYTEPVFLYMGGEDRDAAAPSYLTTSITVMQCNRLRAQLLSSLPLKAYKVSKSGKKTEVTSGPLVELLQKVNPFWTASRLWEMTEMSLGLWGESFVFINKAGRTPKELWWARADLVTVKRSNTEYISHFEYRVPNSGQVIRFERDEVLWFHYPNPGNEFEGLSPLQAAMLAADTSYAAMISNRLMFKNGMQVAGVIGPPDGKSFTQEQANDLEEGVSRRFRGADKAHRWMVMRYDIKFQPSTVTPKDAEFLGTLQWGKEEIANAYGVPLDMIGGQRTYENISASEMAIWQRTMIPEARFIATELTEQLLPLFPGEADLVEFDFSDVAVLQEAERAKWATDKEQIAAGVMTINEWRDEKGKSKLPYGDVWWAPVNLVPVNSGEDLILPQGASVVADKGDGATPPPGDTPPRMIAASTTRAVAYGSPEHEAAYRAHVRQTDRHERRVADVTADLFRRQKSSVLAKLRRDRTALTVRDAEDVFNDPFEMAKWKKTFQQTIKPVLTEVVQDVGTDALVSMGLSIAFDVKQPEVMRAVERQAQQFAQRLNETTYEQLQASLSEGIDKGESIDKLAGRVEDVMGDRIRSSGEVIARSEVNRASSSGDLSAWLQTGVVAGSTWNASLDDRTRPTHVEAHGQKARLGEDFTVGGATGPGPGMMGVAKEDVQCFPGDTIVYAEGIKQGMMRRYDGDVVKLTLDDSRVITVTPNHPLLSDHGWVSAGLLKQGDNLVGYHLTEDAGSPNPDPQNRPTRFDEKLRLLLMAGHTSRVTGTGPQFHGDGTDGEVDVVFTSSELRNNRQATIEQPAPEYIFSAADVDTGVLMSNGAGFKISQRPLRAFHSVVSGVRERQSLIEARLPHTGVHGVGSVTNGDSGINESLPKDAATHTEIFGDGLQRDTALVAINRQLHINGNPPARLPRPEHSAASFIGTSLEVFEEHGVGSGSALDASAIERMTDRRWADTQSPSDGVFRHPGFVTQSKIVQVEVERFAGHVYNLHTKNNYYIANGIIAHNCRCYLTPILDVEWVEP